MKTLLLNSLHSQRGTLIVSDPNIAFILAISVSLGDITGFNDVISRVVVKTHGFLITLIGTQTLTLTVFTMTETAAVFQATIFTSLNRLL